ncbi:MAG: diol dehydratase reactivase subunit alpha, partial [Sarcina sp.]
MKTICGVDIGNSTTEITIASIYKNKEIKFLGSSRVKTSGIKGTVENIIGIRVALKEALIKSNLSIKDINLIKINEASPVISENAMETISETIITNSAMIGHNPDTPAGQGVAIGETINIDCINYNYKKDYIVVIDETFNYDNAAYIINKLVHEGININGAILKADEAVLLYNRLNKKIPIIDEVKNINKVPLGMLAAIEVAKEGKTIKTLSNPYGIANIFSLTADETQKIIPLAKGLIGLRSGVIIKTPEGEVLEKKIKAGMLKIIGKKNNKEVDINEGALSIMKIVNKLDEIIDIEGEKSTNISAMINLIKTSMTDLSRVSREMVRIRDILALDTTVPIKIKGGIAEEVYREKAVAIAAMVKTNKLPLEEIKEKLIKEFKVEVKIEGIEAIMATLGALTTPGTK